MVCEAENANRLQIVYMSQPSGRQHGNTHPQWTEIGGIESAAQGERHRMAPCFDRVGCDRDGTKPTLWIFTPWAIESSFCPRSGGWSRRCPEADFEFLTTPASGGTAQNRKSRTRNNRLASV